MDDTIRVSMSEEWPLTGSAPGRWHSEYIGHSYRSAVEAALARLGSNPATVLKTDLWNESVGGARDIVGHFVHRPGCRFVGVDLAFEVCALARARVANLRVVAADIRALPFRPQGLDAVLDLSTLDHLPEPGAELALAEYGRVLRDRGVLLLVFWQRNAAMRLRLLAKQLLGRSEKPNQHYLSRAAVRAALGERLVVDWEFAAGSLLIPPHPLMNALLRRLPAATLARLVRWSVRTERSRLAKELLKHLAGLYGFVAQRRRGEGGAAARLTTPPGMSPARPSAPAADGATAPPVASVGGGGRGGAG